MPAYKFEALDATGKTKTGLLDADNAKAARAQLRAQALVPLDVAPVAQAANDGKAARFGRRVLSSTELSVWTRQMAGLVGSGLPLERALTALVDEAEDPRQRELVAHLRSEVNAGSPFARALASAPREFDDVYRAVVAAGEQSGALGTVLEKLADDLEERQSLKGKLIGATLYPAIVSLIALVIVIFLVTYVVPQVASVFAGSKRALPPSPCHARRQRLRRQWGWLVILLLVPGAMLPTAAQRSCTERFDAVAACRWSAAWPAAQRGTFCRHAGDAGRRRRADPEGLAGRGRNPRQPRDACRRDGRPGAGARGCAAGQRTGRQEAIPWPVADVRAPG
jgi:general secretion pathway protein F